MEIVPRTNRNYDEFASVANYRVDWRRLSITAGMTLAVNVVFWGAVISFAALLNG